VKGEGDHTLEKRKQIAESKETARAQRDGKQYLTEHVDRVEHPM
jgi:hypothetical protein